MKNDITKDAKKKKALSDEKGYVLKKKKKVV